MHAVDNKFQTFELTNIEYHQARQFSDVQRAFLQNELAARALQRLSMSFDPLAAHEFVQQESYLKGQMELLEDLLNPVLIPNNDTPSIER